MRIHYRETEDGIEIVRCFGADPQIVLPEQICGKPVVRAAAYAFSDRKGREEDDVQVYESEDARLFRQQERLLAGEVIESIQLPDPMREVGRYIFYGCRNLKRLAFSDALTEIGSGAFTGCRGLSSLEVRLISGQRSCVSEILGDLWQRMDVAFYSVPEIGLEFGREAGVELGLKPCTHSAARLAARLVFPEHYEEAVENTPARILFTQHHGSGNNYRQCFYNKEMDYRKYDELFYVAKAHDKISVLLDLVFARLMYPWELTESAGQMYESFVREHGREAAEYVTDAAHSDAMREMSRRNLWNRETLDAAIEHAASARKQEALSFLMNEKHRLFPRRKRDERVL